MKVQASGRWINDEKIQALEFSSHWVRKLLTRANMRRRKITTDDKNVPSDEEITRIMNIGQKMYIDFRHNRDTTINMDETAFTYAIGPEYMYCPPDQQRAQNIGIPNTFLRITAVVAVSANGQFLPLFIIIKHSVSSEDRPDQSGMRVIRDLHSKNKGFGVDDGWDLIKWTKELTIKGITENHACYYIINKVTGNVITSQFKAWNDSVRMIMWLETIIKPLKEKLGKLLIWFDNCGCHKTAVVDDVISELGVQIACLPPNMTGVLQVLDLVVNGPLKAHTRNLRGARIVECFQDFIKQYKEESVKDVHVRTLPTFHPPKPEMLQGIQDLFDLIAGGFTEQKFIDGVRRSFVSTGCAPLDDCDVSQPLFKQYSKHNVCGTMKFIPTRTCETSNHSRTDDDNIVLDEISGVIPGLNAMLEYDSAMLEYDHEITEAMNFISNL